MVSDADLWGGVKRVLTHVKIGSTEHFPTGSWPNRPDTQACTVSTPSGALCVCVVCVICGVVSVSDWVCAVQCQHGTSGDCV